MPVNRNSAVRGRMMAKAISERPGALPLPTARNISAFTHPDILGRWSEEAAAVRAAAAASGGVIEMYDVIGYDFWTGGGVTAKGVAEQLRALRGQSVEVRINSGGGDMFEGVAIYNALREHDAAITVKIMGMASSAASIIAMAGDRVEIGTSSFLMIHNCWTLVIGNRHDMAKASTDMTGFDAAMANAYAQRTGRDVADIAAWMDGETWFSGVDAVERGFADALLPADAVTTDAKAGARAQETMTVRSMEYALTAGGMTRSEARARIREFGGKQDAAPHGVTQDADAGAWSRAATEFLNNLKKG